MTNLEVFDNLPSNRGYFMPRQKDFTRPEYSNPVMDMWEFFHQNPQFTLLKYEALKGGVRVFYTMMS